MGRGHDFEHSVAKELSEGTTDEVNAYRIGYSGNSSVLDQPDVLVTTENHNAALEIKHARQGWRYFDAEELEDVPPMANPTTIPFLVVKFSYYEPLVVRYFEKASNIDGYDDMSVVEQFQKLIPDDLEPHITEEGNFRLTHPKDLDDQNVLASTREGRSDGEVIANGIGAPWSED